MESRFADKENQSPVEYGALGGLLESHQKLINCLETEYKLLRKFHLSGIIVLPHLDNISLWDGVIFIRQGLYKGGIFKFRIEFTDDYPNKPPKVYFKQNIFHPLIDFNTGDVDLMYFFQKWEPGKHYAISCLKEIKHMFYVNDFFSVDSSYNQVAGRTYTRNYTEYKLKCIDCVEESIRNKFDNEEDSSIKFSAFTEAHKKLLSNLKERPEKNENEKVEGFKNWLIGTWKDSLIQNSN